MAGRAVTFEAAASSKAVQDQLTLLAESTRR
jgi:hypothetical protein